MKVNCPECRQLIPLSDVNVSTDIALCRRCEKDFSLSEIRSATEEEVDVRRPPKGAWYRESRGEVEIGATTRSAVGCFLIPFTMVWAGGSMGGIYGSQIKSGDFNLGLSLFGIPFLMGSIFLVSISLMTIMGKTVVRVTRTHIETFSGIGFIGFRKKILLGDVTRIVRAISQTENGPTQKSAGIVLEGKTRHTFAQGLEEARLHFMMNALCKARRERMGS